MQAVQRLTGDPMASPEELSASSGAALAVLTLFLLVSRPEALMLPAASFSALLTFAFCLASTGAALFPRCAHATDGAMGRSALGLIALHIICQIDIYRRAATATRCVDRCPYDARRQWAGRSIAYPWPVPGLPLRDWWWQLLDA